MAGIAETTWLKLQVAHWLSSMRTICIRLHIARYSCLAKFSKTTSLCVDVFFVDFDQNDMNIPAFWRGCIFLIETSVKLQIWNVLFWLHFLFKYQTKMVKNNPKLKIEKSFRHPSLISNFFIKSLTNFHGRAMHVDCIGMRAISIGSILAHNIGCAIRTPY